MQKWLMGGLVAGLMGCGPGVSTSDLEHQLVAANRRIEQLESRINTANARTAGEMEKTALLAQRLSVLEFKTVALSHEEVEGHPALVVTGVNLHLRNGAGATSEVNGRGNLVIGYSERSTGSSEEEREGSHILVIGDRHAYPATAYAGAVIGRDNTISAPYASVTGGRGNHASGASASVVGGDHNHASGERASVSGGASNLASGVSASVTGGFYNVASGPNASIVGGSHSRVGGEAAAVLGGEHNRASGAYATVSGGQQNRAAEYGSTVSGGINNEATGSYSSVSGGRSRSEARSGGWRGGTFADP